MTSLTYTKEETLNLLRKHKCSEESFYNYMFGRTIPIIDGACCYFIKDVDMFLHSYGSLLIDKYYRGDLVPGVYYIKYEGCEQIFIEHLNKPDFFSVFRIEDILAPVPSYEEYLKGNQETIRV